MINLLSPEIKSARRYAKMNVVMVQYTILIAIAICGMSGLMLYGEQTLNQSKADLEEIIALDKAEAEQLEPISKEATELSATIDTIGTLLNPEVKFSFVLQEIGSIIPSGVVLSAISLSQDTSKPMILDVNLVSAERAGVLQQNLIESELFVGADILGVSQGSVSGYGFSGQLQAYFNPDLPLNSLDDPDRQLESAESSQPSTDPVQEDTQ